jgi:integrase
VPRLLSPDIDKAAEPAERAKVAPAPAWVQFFVNARMVPDVLLVENIKTAQVRLGHSDPRLTLAIYAQVTSAADKAAAEVLGGAFLGRS